jgi:uncharacterized membrane protein (UPF0127 family)
MTQLDGGWIVHDTRVVASTNIAGSRRERRRGMKSFPDASVPLVIDRCRWVHSFGMRFAIDVAYLDANDCIVSIRHLAPNRLALPVWRAKRVVEAAPGAFARWDLKVGDAVAIRDTESAPRT